MNRCVPQNRLLPPLPPLLLVLQLLRLLVPLLLLLPRPSDARWSTICVGTLVCEARVMQFRLRNHGRTDFIVNSYTTFVYNRHPISSSKSNKLRM
jgi:hypothetical protein